MENKVTSQLYLWFWGILLKLHTLHSIIYVIHFKNLPYKTNNLYITPTPSKETALISLIAKKILTFPSASLISELSCLFSSWGWNQLFSYTRERETTQTGARTLPWMAPSGSTSMDNFLWRTTQCWFSRITTCLLTRGTNLMQQLWFIIINISTCFGHLYAHLQEYRLCA